MSYALVYITTSDQKEAEKIGRLLVEKRLVACANIIPSVRSFYWWRGELCENSEALILAKTETRLVKKVIAEVKEAHSYEVPDISILEITDGDLDFLKWISKETKDDR